VSEFQDGRNVFGSRENNSEMGIVDARIQILAVRTRKGYVDAKYMYSDDE